MAARQLRRGETSGNSGARAPLPGSIPRRVKRVSGRTDTSRTPAHVRVIGVDLADKDRDLARKKLGARLGKFAKSIERVTVRVTDENGPRGGIDQVCNVKVVLSGLPSVVVERRHARPQVAIDSALRAAEAAVRSSLRRRRMKPRRGRRAGARP